jgi:hypothetical protein
MNASWLCRSIREDLKRRYPHYLSDWVDIFSWKIASSTLFIFLSSFAPAVTFSLLISQRTDNTLGVIEVLLSTSITGILMSIFAGQPVVIVGVTGPISVLTASIYILSKQFGVDFLPFYAWAQIWSAFFHILLAMMNACDAVKYITNFSCETFGVLIALIFIYTGLEGIVKVFLCEGDENEGKTFAVVLLELLLVIGVALSSFYLHSAKYWQLFNSSFRNFVADYGATLSVVLWSIVPYLARSSLQREGNGVDDDIENHTLPMLAVPVKFSTTTGRDWLIDLSSIPAWAIFSAIFPGIILTILFYFDHNVSSVMSQTSEMKLLKGSAFNWDFFVLGIGVLITGLLGLPPSNGLIPQAPLHSKSLIRYRKHYTADNETLFLHEKIYEQRITNFLQSAFCGIATVYPFSVALRQIPQSALYGFFIFLGIVSFEGNEFYSRCRLFFMTSTTKKRLKRDYFSGIFKVPFDIVLKFTAIQAACCAIIFIIIFTPGEVSFPVLIACLVLIRLWILPRYFENDHLLWLDPFVIKLSSSEEELIANSSQKEQIAIADVEDQASFHGESVNNSENESGDNLIFENKETELEHTAVDQMSGDYSSVHSHHQ